MYIDNCVQSCVVQNLSNRKNSKPNFQSSKLWGYKAYKIERELAEMGINSEFHNNGFVAECISKTTELFKKYFGLASLPRNVEFEPIGREKLYGKYNPNSNTVSINSNSKCFASADKLIKEMKQYKHLFFIPDDFSHFNPLHTFVHEYSHCAHFHNLERNGNSSTWNMLSNGELPGPISKLITRFKLSNYATTNMNEFVAERVSKDICSNLDKNDIYTGRTSALDYGKIFESTWNCRYVSPQSYLDYFMQQVWNGNKEEATSFADIVDKYLKEIDRPKEKVKLKQKSLLGQLDEMFGNMFEQANWLDKINRIKQKQYR